MYYSIGQFSKLTKTTIATLRFYDKIDLLTPKYIDENTGYRYYISTQILELQKIISLRQIGISLDKIKLIIKSEDSKKLLKEYHHELKDKIVEMQHQEKKLQILIEKKEPYEVIVKELEDCIVFSKSGKIKNHDEIYNFIQPVAQRVLKINPTLKIISPDYSFLTYLDNEFCTENINIEFCQRINAMGRNTEDIIFKRLKGCKVACLYFWGSYKYIGGGFTYLYDWIINSGYTQCGTPRECYIDGFWNVNDVNLWLTEIQIPIK